MSCTALEMRCDAANDIQMQVGTAADDELSSLDGFRVAMLPHFPLLKGQPSRLTGNGRVVRSKWA